MYDNSWGFTPNSAYWEGRFTNGPVYSELLGEGLGLGPIHYSEDGGDNYAHGGAKTTGTSFFPSLVIDDLDEQVDDFIRGRTADPGALHVVFAGANDFFDGQSNAQVPANKIAADLARLLDHGAKQFLVINLPLLGLTPEYNSNATLAATMTGRAESFNAALETNLMGLEATHADATFHRLDVAGLFTRLIDSPDLFSLTNVTSPASPGLEATGSASGVSIVPNPDEYLFWDTVHPTCIGHQLLSQAALRAVSRPGDFNFDGLVNAADYQAGARRTAR